MRCEAFVAGTAYVQGSQLKVCEYHMKLVKDQATIEKLRKTHASQLERRIICDG